MKNKDVFETIRECRRQLNACAETLDLLYEEYDQRISFDSKSDEEDEDLEYIRDQFDEARKEVSEAEGDLMVLMRGFGLRDWSPLDFYATARNAKGA